MQEFLMNKDTVTDINGLKAIYIQLSSCEVVRRKIHKEGDYIFFTENADSYILWGVGV